MNHLNKNAGLLLIALLTCWNPTSAFAEREGHAGNGIWVGGKEEQGGKLYMADLVEAGMHESPYMDPQVTLNEVPSWILKRLKAKLVVEPKNSGVPEYPVDLIARKLTEIWRVNQVAAVAILRSIEMHSWRMVPQELVNIEDDDFVEDVPVELREQLAVRRHSTIRISKVNWPKLADDLNRAALVFHEAVYALIAPEKVVTQSLTYYVQSASRARDLVGYFYSSEMSALGSEGLWRRVASYFPVTREPIVPYLQESSRFMGWAPSFYIVLAPSVNSPGRQVKFDSAYSRETQEIIQDACKEIATWDKVAVFRVLAQPTGEVYMDAFSGFVNKKGSIESLYAWGWVQDAGSNAFELLNIQAPLPKPGEFSKKPEECIKQLWQIARTGFQATKLKN